MFSHLFNSLGFKQRLILLYVFLISFLLFSVIILFERAGVFPVLFSLGLLAVFFGLKHALDADHIAAIDNTTRKLINDGKKPVGVGFFFSLGHSLSIFALTIVTVILGEFVVKAYPVLGGISNVLGTGISALFLYIIAFMNLLILISIIKVARNFKNVSNKKMEEELLKRGFMFRFFGGVMKLITSSWQMIFVGILFGLGFDTASEVAILSMSAVFALSGRPLIDVLTLPLLFASGMMLLDSTDGVVMQFAYSWAFLNPIRKIFYNISITSISVFLAFCIGTVEAFQVVGSTFHLTGEPWDFLNNLSFAMMGGIIVGILLTAWLLSLGVYKFAKIESRYDEKIS
ncbi:HoxN/HupN/NixA family nickel/cobalt transporter [Candidatus Acidulodesulfobacterium sp. H_13]|uniref:HoxN/HupN/NixA family nickel/cobalt transporter n=1 Tax=Candidatus Acidulodesulfobacterium sp. H_13 TaxID=3395470 RepID=UPI003AF94703